MQTLIIATASLASLDPCTVRNKLFSSPELTVEVNYSDDKMSGVCVCMQTFTIFYFIFPHLYMKFDDKLLRNYSDNADLMCVNQ